MSEENNDNLEFFSKDIDVERKMYMLERRVSLLEQSTRTIKDELSKINNNISKLVWIVLTAVVLAGLNVIFSGTTPGG
jgi:uncharacterized Rmd1/YagE family protein